MEFTDQFLRVFLSDLLYAAPVLIFLLGSICVIGYVIGKVEGWSLPSSMYHAFINATTVGYGDLRPQKKQSRFLAVILALVGLVFTGMVVAIAIHAANHAFDVVYDASTFKGRMGR